MNDPKLDIYSLVVETTRRCNMRCAHCLRGDARDVDLDEKYIRALLEQTAHVDIVTFTGGEPSLALDVIRKFYDVARELGTVPDAFYIATNGAENQLELAKLCLELYAESSERDLCGVTLSVDDYHDADRQDNIVRGLAFYRDDKETFFSRKTHHGETRRGRGDEWVMRTGRAAENGIGRESYDPRDFEVETYDSGRVVVDTLYLACDGRVYADCDGSYDAMDDEPGIPVADATAEIQRIEHEQNEECDGDEENGI